MYRGHPYGHPSAGTVAGLTSTTLADVRKLHETLFTRDRLIVGVAGGYPDGFAEAFARRFKALPAKAPPVKKLPPPPAQKGNQLLVVGEAGAGERHLVRTGRSTSRAAIPTSTR